LLDGFVQVFAGSVIINGLFFVTDIERGTIIMTILLEVNLVILCLYVEKTYQDRYVLEVLQNQHEDSSHDY
jgi:hypothetical protein